MSAGLRFCRSCGRELGTGLRFCNACGHPVPGLDGPTLTRIPAVADPLASQAPPGPVPPPQQGPPPGIGPQPHGRGRPSYLIPLIVAVTVLLVGGGSIGAVALVRHSTAHYPKRVTAAPTPTGSASPVSSGPDSVPPSSSAPPSPPGQVTIGGMTIGISAVNTDSDATAVAATLAAYFGGIDSQNYRGAWDTFTSDEQAAAPYDAFASNESTTQDSQVTVQSIQHDSGGNLEADVSFQSQQAGQYGPNPGETCTDWTLDYRLVPATGVTSGAVSVSYLIDKVTFIGPGHTAC